MGYKMKFCQRAYLPFKRGIDIFGSALAILLLSPLLLICAILTKLTSKGPILFRQNRLGKNETVFPFVKFRSMRTDAPQIPPSEMSIEQQKALVTKWGQFIRKTSLDELPQLFNIFLGHMSFIGPRPGQTYDKEGSLVDARRSHVPSPYLVMPGLSGYAQIHLHRAHDVDKKAADDSYYVKHISFFLDAKIFIYSFLAVFGVAKGR